MSTGMAFLILAACAAVYLLPAIVASRRRHRDVGSIMFLNLLFGWTVIGWVCAFLWALTGNVKEKP